MNKKNITFPNQKVIHINKPNLDGNYLSVGINDWAEASKNLSPNTFKVYLYIASNADGFDLALSRQAVMNLLSISKDSYIRAVKELEDKHYIVLKQGNIYDFYTVPMYASVHTTDEGMYADTHTVCMQECIHDVCKDATSMYAPTHTEINNINNKNKINNSHASHGTRADALDIKCDEDKWLIKDEKQHTIFDSWFYTDKQVMENIEKLYVENNNTITRENIKKSIHFHGVDVDILLEYAKEVLDKKFKKE